MYITMCLYITITILLWVLSIYPFIKNYTIVVSIITIQFSHMTSLGFRGLFTFNTEDIFQLQICITKLFRYIKMVFV